MQCLKILLKLENNPETNVQQHLPILAKIDQNRAKIALFRLETRINCYLNSEIWANQLILKSLHNLNYGKYQ